MQKIKAERLFRLKAESGKKMKEKMAKRKIFRA